VTTILVKKFAVVFHDGRAASALTTKQYGSKLVILWKVSVLRRVPVPDASHYKVLADQDQSKMGYKRWE
jgi:hypothetical protein